MTLAQLLVVQKHDSAIDRHKHDRANLPEYAAITMVDDERTHLDAQRAAFAAERHAVDRDQKRLEDDVALITDRYNSESERLYSGSVTSHKDLQLIQEELATLDTRRSELEDQILEVMEIGEPIDAKLEQTDQQLGELATRRDQIMASMAESEARIDAEIDTEEQLRRAAAAEIDAALLVQYETTRADCGGIGVSRLMDKTCEGCHLQLAAIELDRIRKEPDDALIRCGECTRILVR